MFDPFGLRREMESPQEIAPSTESTAAPSGDKRLWAVLLILDTVFIVIFGGALGLTLYSRFSNPPIVMPERMPVRNTEQPKKTAPAPAPAPAPVTAAPATQPQQPAPHPVVAATSATSVPDTPPDSKTTLTKGPLGSPSVLSPNLPRRQASLSGPGAASTPAIEKPVAAHTQAPPKSSTKAPSAGKAKAVEFTCVAKDAQEVKLKGPFLVRTGGFKKMTRANDGIWHTEVSLLPGSYRYYFVIDGKKSKPQTLDVQ